jgi:hypothetical protein
MLCVLSESIAFFWQKALFWTPTVTSGSHFICNRTLHAPPPARLRLVDVNSANFIKARPANPEIFFGEFATKWAA